MSDMRELEGLSSLDGRCELYAPQITFLPMLPHRLRDRIGKNAVPLMIPAWVVFCKI